MNAVALLWGFEQIAADDPARATRLENSPSAESIAASVLARFEGAVASNAIRIGMEESGSNSNELRVTLQFHVGQVLSDNFFNSNTGYRAEFRRGWQHGLAYNNRIVTSIHALVTGARQSTFKARRLTSKFDDCGELVVTREQICKSLVPDLSKVWFCARLVSADGTITQLPTGVVGPRLRLDQYTTWAAVSRDDDSSWLDVKGAFIGEQGAYQPKDPIERAKKLAACGEA